MPSATTVLFVCLHGSAKSVIAAEQLRKLAAERGVAVYCRSAGLEPDADLPAHVVSGLTADGIETTGLRPRLATRELLAGADRVIAFGCDLSPLGAPAATRWDGVPAVSDGYEVARDAIVARLGPLIDELDCHS